MNPADMNDEAMEHFLNAGKVAAECLMYGKSLIKPGGLVVEVLDKIEEKILSMGCGIAFPAQISFNQVAAHECSRIDDQSTFDDQLIKLDIGAHSNGFVADNAISVDLSGEHTDLLNASKDALKAAIALVKPGAKPSEIGGAIAETIEGYGFQPIKNLSGHGIGQWVIHDRPGMPNYNTGAANVLEAGMAIAIEPFASSGAGKVIEQGENGVLMQVGNRPVRDMIARKVLKHIEEYNGLPFAKRWIQREFGNKAEYALAKLVHTGNLQEYPPLVDVGGGLVSQHEHSMVVTKDGCVVTTKRDE